MSITVEQVRESKHQLEKNIMSLIRMFEEGTGTTTSNSIELLREGEEIGRRGAGKVIAIHIGVYVQ